MNYKLWLNKKSFKSVKVSRKVELQQNSDQHFPHVSFARMKKFDSRSIFWMLKSSAAYWEEPPATSWEECMMPCVTMQEIINGNALLSKHRLTNCKHISLKNSKGWRVTKPWFPEIMNFTIFLSWLKTYSSDRSIHLQYFSDLGRKKKKKLK